MREGELKLGKGVVVRSGAGRTILREVIITLGDTYAAETEAAGL